jgi:hypothetical protein
MNQNNSGFIFGMNESDFTAISSIATDMKQMADKIQKLEVNFGLQNVNYFCFK